MTDWHALARARGLDIPENAVSRIVPALDGLEAAFQALTGKLTVDVEPAVTLSEGAVLAK